MNDIEDNDSNGEYDGGCSEVLDRAFMTYQADWHSCAYFCWALCIKVFLYILNYNLKNGWKLIMI